MNRKFRLATAIIAISISALELIFGILLMASGLLFLYGVVVTGLTLPTLVLAILLLTKQRGLLFVIALLVLNVAIMAVALYVIYNGVREGFYSLIPHAAVFTLLVVFLVKGNNAAPVLPSKEISGS